MLLRRLREERLVLTNQQVVIIGDAPRSIVTSAKPLVSETKVTLPTGG
jgi:hypothetical protein